VLKQSKTQTVRPDTCEEMGQNKNSPFGCKNLENFATLENFEVTQKLGNKNIIVEQF
jgi:hypothetical protein